MWTLLKSHDNAYNVKVDKIKINQPESNISILFY
jgi:hypothetical protein